ncbi:MAG: UPF0175 family protein [Bacteroidales bacterium]|nr:UPF0175 family protein [Bacteroidales bacterium]NLK80888.1 UPF0175 family protein [Bacteroidales bacterium]HPY82069.1 UPF0175 family protein [Bacteroidales bacterium]
MKTITLNIPHNLGIDDFQLTMLLASKLYEQGRLSLGQAADFVGLSKKAFAELLGKYDVSIFNFPSSELSKDVLNA